MPPVVLGIDTSSSWCSAALLDGAMLAVRRESVGNAHSRKILAMVGAVLDEAGMTLDRCDVVAYSAGPGSFTGLRVAAAVAQGLAYGAGIEVASIGTLDAIAHSVVGHHDAHTLLVAQDARMGEIYWALFERREDGWSRVSGPSLSTAPILRQTIRATRGSRSVDLGCGNAWVTDGTELVDLVDDVLHREAADAADVARLGAIEWRLGRLGPPDTAQPVYVRNDVARTTAERAALRTTAPVAIVAAD